MHCQGWAQRLHRFWVLGLRWGVTVRPAVCLTVGFTVSKLRDKVTRSPRSYDDKYDQTLVGVTDLGKEM